MARIFVESARQPKTNPNSPSLYNTEQATDIVDAADYFVSKGINGILVDPKNIGIVSPYASQRSVLEDKLKAKDLDGVQVGTVEYFQGRKKDIILVYTVYFHQTSRKL